jgi:hypothetical protein
MINLTVGNEAMTILHEVGHFFMVQHTTVELPDLPIDDYSDNCKFWPREGVAREDHGVSYGSLSSSQQTVVDTKVDRLLQSWLRLDQFDQEYDATDPSALDFDGEFLQYQKDGMAEENFSSSFDALPEANQSAVLNSLRIAYQDSDLWHGYKASGISRVRFGGRSYAELSEAERKRVDDLVYNIMSQCTSSRMRSRLSQAQLDIWMDAMNNNDVSVTADGRFVHVDAAQDPLACVLNECGLRSQQPFADIYSALGVAGPEDIVLLRPGQYLGATTISTATTLLATQEGSATLGE